MRLLIFLRCNRQNKHTTTVYEFILILILPGVECWGKDAPKEGRWRKVLTLGTREGEEMARSWALITREVHQSAAADLVFPVQGA